MAEDTVKMRCPYCKNVFLAKKKLFVFTDSQAQKTFKCPYCREQLVVTKQMVGR